MGAAYPNGAKDMPATPPVSNTALGDHDPELFNFWKQIHENEDQYEVALARPLGIVFEEIAPLGAVSARDMMPKKLGARWYTGYQAAYPNGAKDMPATPPVSNTALGGGLRRCRRRLGRRHRRTLPGQCVPRRGEAGTRHLPGTRDEL